MAKEEAEKEKKQKKEKKDKKDDKEKKDKKRKRSETEDGHKSKKEKRDKGGEQDGEQDGDVTMTLLDSLEDKASPPTVSQVNGDVIARSHRPVGALLPFANPLADEKVQKKVLKSVKKAAKNRSIKRGVKEVVKAVRKSPITGPGGTPPGIVILAADISPMDVISHIPVLCEDHNIPYLFVTSRAELGAAGSTKRPTSVVMVSPEGRRKKKKDEGEGEAEVRDGEEYKEVYKSLFKLVEKESRNVKV